MTTTPTPPKGRRWVRVGEIKRKWDRIHGYAFNGNANWIHTIDVGGRVEFPHEYSRGISHRKKTRKQLK